MQGLSWKRCHLDASIYAKIEFRISFRTDGALPNVRAVNFEGTNAYDQECRLLNRVPITSRMVPLPLPKIFKHFLFVWPQTFSTLLQSISNGSYTASCWCDRASALFMDDTVNCVHGQWFLKVFLSPCSDFHDRHHVCFNAVLPEGPEVRRLGFSALLLVHTDFSRFSEYFNDIVDCRWWDCQSLDNPTLRIIILKLFRNSWMTFFADFWTSFTSEKLCLSKAHFQPNA